jgi:hypothetical protein
LQVTIFSFAVNASDGVPKKLNAANAAATTPHLVMKASSSS